MGRLLYLATVLFASGALAQEQEELLAKSLRPAGKERRGDALVPGQPRSTRAGRGRSARAARPRPVGAAGPPANAGSFLRNVRGRRRKRDAGRLVPAARRSRARRLGSGRDLG